MIKKPQMSYYLSLPLVTVLVTLNFFKWDIVLALISGILLILILNIPQYKKFIKSMNGGAVGSVTAIINTSAAVGFGTVVRAVPGFDHSPSCYSESKEIRLFLKRLLSIFWRELLVRHLVVWVLLLKRLVPSIMNLHWRQAFPRKLSTGLHH